MSRTGILDEMDENENRLRLLIPIFLAGLGLILIIGSIIYLRTMPLPSDPSVVPAQVNYSAPELTLTNLAGASQSLAQYSGQVVLVNLWATWCPPCKAEMPALQAYQNKHDDQGFVVIAINDGDPTSDVAQFVEDYKLTFPVWLDPTYIATEQAFKTLNLPSSYVIDRNGMVRLMWVGEISKSMLEKHVTPIIWE